MVTDTFQHPASHCGEQKLPSQLLNTNQPDVWVQIGASAMHLCWDGGQN